MTDADRKYIALRTEARRRNPHLPQATNREFWTDGYCTGYQSRQREIDEMLSIIREMVELKDLSERIKARGSAVREAKENGDAVDLSDQVLTDWIADYTNRKEIAWQKMRELAKLDKTARRTNSNH
jgi:hypothetical protein